MIAARIAALGNTAERVALIHEIADIIGKYRVVNGPSGWAVVDLKTGNPAPAPYASEPMARAGARLLAACDVVEMLEKAPV